MHPSFERTRLLDPKVAFNVINVGCVFENDTPKLVLGTVDGKVRIWNFDKARKFQVIYVLIYLNFTITIRVI